MTAESHNSERSPAGGGCGRPGGRRRGLVRGGRAWRVNVPHSAGKVEVDESPHREINIAQRRRSPLHTPYTHRELYIHEIRVPRATTRAHTGMYRVTYTEKGGHIYVHSGDDTYNAAADTLLSRPCPSTSSAPHVPPHRCLDSTPKDSLTLRHRVWRREAAAGPRKGTGTGVRETAWGQGEK